jgi:hypothetical protein
MLVPTQTSRALAMDLQEKAFALPCGHIKQKIEFHKASFTCRLP